MALRKRGGLGSGLEALIPRAIVDVHDKESIDEKVEASRKISSDDVVMLKLTKVEPDRSQPRKQFDEEAMKELAESIKNYGVLEPILVQDCKDHYEIIMGERRWRAARMAGLKEIRAIIVNYTPQQIAEIQLIENIQREDLNPIEEAQAYRRLVEEFHVKQDEIASKVSKSRTAVANTMRLLKLTDEVQKMVLEKRLSSGHARALVPIEDPKKQVVLANMVIEKNLSVRETEAMVRNLDKKKPVRRVKDDAMEAIYRDLEKKMEHSLGTKVSIVSGRKNRGKLEIEFYNSDDLDKLIRRLV